MQRVDRPFDAIPVLWVGVAEVGDGSIDDVAAVHLRETARDVVDETLFGRGVDKPGEGAGLLEVVRLPPVPLVGAGHACYRKSAIVRIVRLNRPVEAVRFVVLDLQ